MKIVKTGITFLIFIGLTATGCAIKTCPTYSKAPVKLEKEQKIKGEVRHSI